MSNNDQFRMARLPLKPISFANRNLAECNEILIDYEGEDKTYHIYITDSKDRTKFIDITELIIREGFPNINADNFRITIDGEINAFTLHELLNFIYKNFLMPEDSNGFIYSEDIDKVMDINTKDILMKDTDEIIYLPVTLARNVLDETGTSIQERLDKLSRVGFATTCVKATTNNQVSFEFEYPFPNYRNGGNYLEVRIGTTYIDKYRYEIIDTVNSDGNVYGATLAFTDENIEIGRSINILFIYNSAESTGGELEYMYGGFLANGSVPIYKLDKVSDSFTNNDSTSVATSKSVYKLYKETCNMMSDLKPEYTFYTNESNCTISNNNITIKNSYTLNDGCKIYVNLTDAIHANATITVNSKIYNINTENGNPIDYSIASGKILKLVYSKLNNCFITNYTGDYNITTNRLVKSLADKQVDVSFSGLEYQPDDQIFVYRNGVRLFESIDYSINLSSQNITLYVRGEDDERIVFETYELLRR